MEFFKDIKGYEGKYQISNLGRVWSIKNQKILKPKTDQNGYLSVGLIAKNGKRKDERVHRLVALMFCEKLEGATIVNHLNGVRNDNRAENLEWTTVKGNTIHGYYYGNVKSAQKKATEAARIVNTKIYEVYKNGEYIGIYKGLIATAQAANVSEKTVRNCIKENRCSRNGFFFKEVVNP